MKKKIYVWALLQGLSIILFSQTYFDFLYGEAGNFFRDLSEGRAHQLPDSTYLFSFYTNDVSSNQVKIKIYRLDATGELLNSMELGEPGFSLYAKDCIPLSDNYFLLLGAKKTIGSNQMGIILNKYDADFSLVWSRSFFDGENHLWGSDIYPTSDGGYLIAGRTWLYNPVTGAFIDEQALLIRADSTGEELWRRTYGSPSLRERLRGIAPTNDGGYLLAGSSSQPVINGDVQAMLLKINHLGHLQWEKKIGSPLATEYFSHIISTSDGNYAIAGEIGKKTLNGPVTAKQQWLVKLSPWGIIIWEQRYPEASLGTWLIDLVELPDGSLVAAGAYKGPPGHPSQAGFIRKATADGEPLWSHLYDRNPDYIDLFSSINTTLDGGFVLTGFARRPDGSSQDAWILKVDSMGCREPGCLPVTSVDQPLPPRFEGFALWPNPTSGPLRAQWAQPLPPGAHLLLIYDASGRLLRQSPIEPGAVAHDEDLSTLPPGLYIVVWETLGQGRVVRRVVKGR